MVHNHAVVFNPAFKQHEFDGMSFYLLEWVLDDDGYDVRCDLTVQFEQIFPEKVFDTFQEFLDKLEQFQEVRQTLASIFTYKITGCIFVKRNADRYPPEAVDKQHLVYKAVKMECVHYGHRQDSKKQSHANLRY